MFSCLIWLLEVNWKTDSAKVAFAIIKIIVIVIGANNRGLRIEAAQDRIANQNIFHFHFSFIAEVRDMITRIVFISQQITIPGSALIWIQIRATQFRTQIKCSRSAVKKVYPEGFKNHPGHEVHRTQAECDGAVLTCTTGDEAFFATNS